MRKIVQEFVVSVPSDKKYFRFSLELPKKAEILEIQEKQGGLNISALTSPKDAIVSTETRNFMLTGPNDAFKGHEIIKYIGIVQLPKRGLNFYLFEMR